jgi:hypothetical protein
LRGGRASTLGNAALAVSCLLVGCEVLLLFLDLLPEPVFELWLNLGDAA